MKIRKIQPQDRAGLKALLHAQQYFKPEEIKVALEITDIVLNHLVQEDYTIHIAEGSAGEVLGCIGHRKVPLTDADYDIYWIVVHPAFWNQGLGSSVFRRAEADLRCRRARLLLIETSSRPPYEALIAFYRRHGYREQARIPNYYAVGEHKLIFAKTFGP